MSDDRNLRRIDVKRIEKGSGISPSIAPRDKPKSAHPTCMSCRFMWDLGVHPQDITKHIIECRWGPPSDTIIPVGGGVGTFTGPPQPANDYWCYRHEPVEDAAAAPSPLIGA